MAVPRDDRYFYAAAEGFGAVVTWGWRDGKPVPYGGAVKGCGFAQAGYEYGGCAALFPGGEGFADTPGGVSAKNR